MQMNALKSGSIFKTRTLLFVLLFFSLKQAAAVSWYVSPAGNDTLNGLYPTFITGYKGPKKTIKNTLLWANPGDTIFVQKGTYPEHVVLNKDMYVISDSAVVRTWEMAASSVYCLISGNTFSISDSLILNQGFMYINSKTVKLRMLSGSKIYGGNAGSFVEGRLYYALIGGTGKLFFPLGIVGDYRPMYLNYHQNVVDNRFHWIQMVENPAPVSNKLPAGIRNISQVRYWMFGREKVLPTDYIFDLGYDSTIIDDGVREPSTIRCVFNSDTSLAWKNLNGNGNTNRKGLLSAGNSTDTVGFISIGNVIGGFNPLGSDLPFALYSYTGACVKSPTKFTDKSYNEGGASITKWSWDFGVIPLSTDTSTKKNPSFTYTSPGTYTVKLVVTNSLGYKDSVSKAVVIHALPSVKFSAAAVCYNDLSLLVDSSKITGPDTIKSRIWKVSDGFTSTAKKAARIFPSTGTYNIKLIVTSSAGCVDSANGSTLIRSLPKVGFTTKNVCATDSAIYRRIKGLDSRDSTFTYQWNIDNAIVGTDTVQKMRYNSGAVHSVILIATDKFGCVDLDSRTDTSFGLPKLSFRLNKSIAGNDSLQCKTTNQFTFTYKATASQKQSLTASWAYGDGNVGILKDSTHIYLNTGIYTVKLYGVTNRGCMDSISAKYVVRGTVNPRIAKIGICAPDSVTLYDSLSPSSSPIVSWKWSLPGGATDTGKKIRVWNKFPTPGLVKLVVKTAEGCMDSISKAFSYTLYPIPTVWIPSSSSICAGDSLVVSVTGGTAYKWLNDGDTTSVKKVFKAGGLYPVRVFNGPFCAVNDSTLLITVKPAAVIKAYSDTTIERNTSAFLRATGGVSYAWTPSGSLNFAVGSKVTATPMVTTRYIVTGKSSLGCQAQDSVLVTVREPLFVRIPNLITPNGDGQNDAWVIWDIKDLTVFDLTITDYAGKIVFTSSSYQNNWNATQDGKELPEGIFYYRLHNRDTNENLKGFIQVIR
jgi:gliding motility-associated-like protein